MIQHLIRIFVIPKRNILKGNMSLHIRHLHSIGTVLDIRFYIHDLPKTLKSGIAILKLFRKINQRFDGFTEYTDIQKKCHQIADIHTAAGNQRASDQNYIDLNECRKHTHARLKTPHVTVTVSFCRKKSIISLFEFLVLHFFVGKGFYHTYTGQVIFDLCIDIRDLHSVSSKCRTHLFIQDKSESKHKWQYQKGRQRQHSINIHKDHQGSQDFQHRQNNILRTVVQKLCDIKKVCRDPAHQLSDFRIIVESKGQLLHMVKNLCPHIVFYFCPHHMTVISDKIPAEQIHQKQHRQKQTNLPQPCKHPVFFHIDQCSGHITHHQRNGQSHRSRQGRKEHICQKNVQIWPVI